MNTLRNLLVTIVAFVMAFTFSIVGTVDAGYSIPGRTSCTGTDYLGSRICVDYSMHSVYIYVDGQTYPWRTGSIQWSTWNVPTVGYVAYDSECFSSGYDALGHPITWMRLANGSYLTFTYGGPYSAAKYSSGPFNDVKVFSSALSPDMDLWIAALANSNRGYECVFVP